MKKIIVLIAMILLMASTSMAQTTVGASPDPYSVIWESATEEDMNALRQCVYYESARAFYTDDESQVECNVAVVETVLNRCLQEGKRFPNTIAKVVYQNGEFCIKKRTIKNDRVEQAIEHVKKYGLTVLPDYDYVHFATKKQSVGKDHVWHGGSRKGMWFARSKEWSK